eukprot:5181464-Pyramimonas_sp.AAC.1
MGIIIRNPNLMDIPRGDLIRVCDKRLRSKTVSAESGSCDSRAASASASASGAASSSPSALSVAPAPAAPSTVTVFGHQVNTHEFGNDLTKMRRNLRRELSLGATSGSSRSP